MCYAVKCEKCGKTTWAGCGRHKDSVMEKVPEDQRCVCPRETSSNCHCKITWYKTQNNICLDINFIIIY